MTGYKRCKSSNFTIKKQNELIIKKIINLKRVFKLCGIAGIIFFKRNKFKISGKEIVRKYQRGWIHVGQMQ